jgi:hypothetical protein
MNTAVFSVVYPGVEPYLSEFLHSLSNQTDLEFTLYLINDNFLELNHIIGSQNLKYKVITAKGTPAQLRKKGIQWLVREGVDVVIFADADDKFSENRVEVSKNILNYSDIVFNELVLFGKGIQFTKPMLGSHYPEGYELNDESLNSFNCIGLSNSAIKLKLFFNVEDIPNHIIAFDWTFFSMFLLLGAKIRFTKKTHTYYRQYEKNQASPLNLADDQIVRGIKVKRDHFHFLSKQYDQYQALFKSYEKLYQLIKVDDSFKQKYIVEVRNQAPENPLWWEPIKTVEELGI